MHSACMPQCTVSQRCRWRNCHSRRGCKKTIARLYIYKCVTYVFLAVLQAYCDTQVVNEVVLPLLSMSSSVLLCISTLRESDNFYSRMFGLRKADGNLLFETIQIDLVCAACRASDNPQRYASTISCQRTFVNS